MITHQCGPWEALCRYVAPRSVSFATCPSTFSSPTRRSRCTRFLTDLASAIWLEVTTEGLAARMAKHTALYCRISKDKNGRAEGVGAQERWGRDYCASAWADVPAVVYADNDISASNGDHRPGYEALREAIRRGDVAHVWCVEQS